MVQHTLGTQLGREIIVNTIDTICSTAMECDQTNLAKLRGGIIPLVFDEILSERNLCTYELQLCDMDKY